MRKIIRGKRYDTDTADFVCCVSNNLSRRDFRFVEADMFKTKRSKEFFLAGSGGPMTVFADHPTARTAVGQDDVIILIDEDMAQWLFDHMASKKIMRNSSLLKMPEV